MTAAIQWNDAALLELYTDPFGPVGLILEALAVEVEETAKSLVSRPGSGRVYTHAGTSHQAAAPGEPFSAEDNDTLRDSIDHSLSVAEGFLVAEVGTDEADGLWQELGTRNMPAHPFLRPALMMLQGTSASDVEGSLAAVSLGRALTSPTRERRAVRGALKTQNRQAKAVRSLGRALSAAPRAQRSGALAARRIGRALRGLGK